jgi:type II secretory pathway component GspD/PulD (secretin)
MHLELPMQYLDMETVDKFLSGLYPKSDDNGSALSYGLQTHTNTVFLRGPGEQVTQAAALLRAADHDPAHVVIEALVVQFRASEIEQLGIDITNLTAGSLSDMVTNFGSLTTPAAAFTFTRGANNITALSALIQALIAQNYARLVARPYVSTLSGKEATVNITRNQFIVVNRPEDGAAVSALEPITAGVTLKITPTIMPTEMIRMVIDVEDSQFVATSASTPGNIQTELEKSVATSVMQVENGTTIIIGGLTRHQVSRGNAGLPWLRRLPPFSLLFANQAALETHDEVVIYVTPYIWKPGLQPPLPAPAVFAVPADQGGASRLEKLGLPPAAGHK